MKSSVQLRLLVLILMAGVASHALAAGKDLKADDVARKAGKPVSGKLWANGDDEFVLYVNDKRIAARPYTDDPESKQVTLKPGDLLIARVTSADAVRGFAFLFQGGGGKVEFSSNTGDWYAFQPQNTAQWWQVRDFSKVAKTRATATDHQEVRGNIERLAETGCQETLWGDPSKSTVYLIKLVTADDLTE
jgi:hypothetical protein